MALTGCADGQQTQTLYKGLKISDLAPAASHQTDRQSPPLVELVFTFFELPAENFDVSADIWSYLYTAPLKFANPDAFEANGFAAGFGDQQAWSKTREVLQAARARRVSTVTRVAFDQQPRDTIVAPLNDEQTVFFTDTQGRIVGATLPNGATALRITAAKIPGSRGLVKVNVLPVFKSASTIAAFGQLPDNNSGDVIFDSTGFELKISPGEFVLLGPARRNTATSGMTLSGLFFTADKPNPVVRMYLMMCNRIKD